MIQAEETEKEFDRFFRQISYTRVSEDLGNSPNFKNADYVNKKKQIIVELKVLEKERIPGGGMIQCLNTILVKPEKINRDGSGMYSFNIPDLDRKGRMDSIEEPLRLILKKANKQLKETKAFYASENLFTGYVILAQTGFMSISPEVTAGVVTHILNNEFNSIDGVIICTPHYNLINSLTRELDYPLSCATKLMDSFLHNQCLDIANAWYKFYQEGGHSQVW